MGNAVKFPCGDTDDQKKIPYMFSFRELKRSDFKLEKNPNELTKDLVILDNVQSFKCKEFKDNKQILISLTIVLLNPKELTIDLSFTVQKLSLKKTETTIQNMNNIILKVNEEHVIKFADENEKIKFICWGGIDEFIKDNQKPKKIIVELYGQNYKNIPKLDDVSHAPYYIDNSNNLYIDENSFDVFKKHIEEKILSSIKYHLIEKTKIKFKKGDDVNIMLKFHVINFSKKKLKSKYQEYKMIIPAKKEKCIKK